jgi:hypothetical protein
LQTAQLEMKRKDATIAALRAELAQQQQQQKRQCG